MVRSNSQWLEFALDQAKHTTAELNTTTDLNAATDQNPARILNSATHKTTAADLNLNTAAVAPAVSVADSEIQTGSQALKVLHDFLLLDEVHMIIILLADSNLTLLNRSTSVRWLMKICKLCSVRGVIVAAALGAPACPLVNGMSFLGV